METPETLQEAITHFAEFENCRQFMISVRWVDGKVLCPTCGSDKVSYLAKARLYKCYGNHPRPKFSLKVGTVFEDSPVQLEKWLPAVWFIVNCKNGISSHEIGRALGVTQKTAWFMLHRIRIALKDGSFNTPMGGPGNECEADETFIGGKAKNMHLSRKIKLLKIKNEIPTRKLVGTNPGSMPGKTPIAGVLDRETRKVRATVMTNIKRETIQNHILSSVQPGSHVYTDSAIAYDKLSQHYTHEIVNHLTTYVNGRVHTNGIENFWSLLKRGLHGTYVSVEPFHLGKYVDEQVFRFNHRATKENKMTDADRFGLALSQIVGKRLTYDELTGKTNPERLPQ